MSFIPAIIGGVTGIAIDETKNAVRRAITSTADDGGRLPRKRPRHNHQINAFRRIPPPTLSAHQKAHASWSMVQNLMPRMKSVTWNIFNHHNEASLQPADLYSGKNNLNTAILLHNRSGDDAETPFMDQYDVIPSGLSMTVRKSGVNMDAMQNSGIFPISHPGLIVKGDDFNQRLGDFVQLNGMHIVGRIEVRTFYPMFDGASPFTVYPKSNQLITTTAKPHSLALDPQRKVRLMIVEIPDAGEDAGTGTTDTRHYENSQWKETDLVGAQSNQLFITGAPRLQNLLEVDDLLDSVRTLGVATADRTVTRDGRWLQIDRKYRSNNARENTWIDPANEGRKVDFNVLLDVSFVLSPSWVPKNDHNTDQAVHSRFNRNSYVDIDMFVKLNKDLSYVSAASGADLTTTSQHADKGLFIYLFDDHVDHLTGGATSDPTASANGHNALDEVVDRGYSMTKALLQAEFFFNDDV